MKPTFKDLDIPENEFKTAIETDMNTLTWDNDPQIEEINFNDDEVKDDIENKQGSIRYKCFNCHFIYGKSYRTTQLCTNCHTKNSLIPIYVEDKDLFEIDNQPIPGVNYDEQIEY